MTVINGNPTNFSNLIEPTVFLDWIYRQNTQTNRFVQSGVLKNDPVLGGRLLQPGRSVEIPAMNDLSGDADEWNDTNDIQTNGVDSAMEYGIKMYQFKSFGNTDWGDLISGASTQQQIANRFGNWWTRQDTKLLLDTVKATFNNTDIATAKSYGVGSEKELSAADFVKALARMGDVMDNTLSTLVVNSAAYSEMREQQLIEYLQPAGAATPIATYQGMSIVQDDSIPVASDGTTYALIFGPGAIDYATATPTNGLVVQRDEFQKGGMVAIIQKRVVTCHVAGTDVDLTQTKPDTYLADLAAGTKPLFQVSYDPRQIQLVKYGFKVGTDYVVPTINSPKASGASGSSTSSSSSSSSSTSGSGK